MLNKPINKQMYTAFGLNVLSEIPLPELSINSLGGQHVDVVIHYADLKKEWNSMADGNIYFIVKPDLVMFQIPNLAIFKVEHGKNISFSPTSKVDEDHIRLYLLGTCMGAILMQRKILPLHGSAIAIDGKAYAIVGDSGAGKSTTASALLARGYQLISDDVIPVSLNEGKVPMVTPAYPQQKLWQESIDEFGMESRNYRPIIDRETKFAIPVLAQFSKETLPLAGVFELVKTEDEKVSIKPIEKLERFHTLFYHTYRNFFLKPAGLMEWHFQTCAAMVNHLEIFQLQRPKSRFTANDLTGLILSTIKREVNV
ncbi:hypothetical protein J2S74_004012 [Evansella vedderi]|uniref:HPr kinase/phosphorylase C-terminal domain-containing protein n=1 Tax=Evansella vedderi TaxID=38282 RepID=A0ABT9ZZB6_9BACI|nr:aldolase [Evansella vedderi]MDQ0256590.1 hypothetical protein [Evansella vedderi]